MWTCTAKRKAGSPAEECGEKVKKAKAAQAAAVAETHAVTRQPLAQV